LAVGGMAELFLARAAGPQGFSKLCVIKRVLPHLAEDPAFVEMFLDEARIAATLQHPNVVQMYDVGVVDGNYFIAMEYLHGEDVRSISKAVQHKEQRLPIEHALNIVIGLASGLHYAHEKVGFDGKPLEIVHRDVTPQNVIVTYDGAVKLLDFGIAKASNRFGETRFGTLKGKVPYMSPEQGRGEALDRRSDIFSLGIMLYELTLGRRLFQGKSDFEVLKQIVEGTVAPPSEYEPQYPPELEAIVMRALVKEKESRYQTARDLQVDLEALVRADRLHVSPIALQSYMAELFGHKIEAWQDAQAKGKSLGEHLETMQLESLADDDDEHNAETEARDAERLAAERAAFRARVDAVAAVETQALPASELVADVVAPAKRRAWLWPSAIAAVLLLVLGVWRLARSPAVVERPAPPAQAVATAPQANGEIPAAEGVNPNGQVEPVATPLPPKTNETKADKPHKVATTTPAPRVKAKPLAPIQAGKRPVTPPSGKLAGEGTLMLASSPWCRVSIDGVDHGPTPVSAKLPAGRHVVLLTNPEFKISRTLPVFIPPNETVRKRLDFAQ
ncbi:MAG TPA: protein kinase, partial [Polyangia bacterium]|nr:protein kinase [Polyangia bacterium]